MNYYEPEDDFECPACLGEGQDDDGADCELCEGTGSVSRQERRDYIDDARADDWEDR